MKRLSLILLVGLVLILSGCSVNKTTTKQKTNNDQSKPSVIVTPTPVSTPTPAPVRATSTVGTKLFKGGGISLRYPKDWAIQDWGCSDLGGIICRGLAPTSLIEQEKQKYNQAEVMVVVIGFSVDKIKGSLRDWTDTFLGAGPFAEDKDLTINGHPAIFVKEENSYTDYSYYITNNKLVVSIGIRTYEDLHPGIYDYSMYLPIFQSMVASINFDDNTGLK